MTAERLDTLRRALAAKYAITRELGRGGMATVYVADDIKHGREVALKVIHDVIGVSLGHARFEREIRIAAQLSHPHIVPLFDSGEAADMLFYVMPYVAGESLRQRLRREGQLAVEEAVRLVRQVASALDYAHARGLLHRDISPENILLHEGEAMVTDFGIALTVDQPDARLTTRGVTLGKAEYMSPEQAAAEPHLDARSDVYSLACVLYELLAGEPPFTGPTMHAVLAKRFTDPIPSVRRVRASVPDAIDSALARALARVPADRFPSAGAFAAALEAGSAAAGAAPKAPSVAVLPFRNLTRDQDSEYFADGITEDVIAHLSKIRGLKVISRSSVMQYKERGHTVRQIADALNTTTVLVGSVRRAADRVRIVAELIDTDSDRNLWAETYDRQFTDVFTIQSDVAEQIAVALKAELSADERRRIRKEPTCSVQAYQLYVRGRNSFADFSETGILRAIDLYEQAIVADPEFALAHAAIAFAYAELHVQESGSVRRNEAYERARAAAERAIALDPSLGEAHGVLGLLLFTGAFDWTTAESELKKALELNPGSADIHDHYAWLCTAMGRYDEAIDLTRRALELDPLVHRSDFATALLRAGRYEEAIQAARRIVDTNPEYARGHSTLGWAYFNVGRMDEALAHLEHAAQFTTGDTTFLAQLGQLCGLLGNHARAHDTLRQLQQLAATRYVSPYHLAFVYIGLGQYDDAMDQLEHAYAVRSGALYNLKGSLLLAPLRSHPRFTALLRKVNLA